MAEPIVIPAGGGEVIGDSADRTVLVLSDCDELHATWSRFGAGRDGAGLHIHREHTDLFYVLEGELTVKLADDEEVAAGAGTLVTIPPLVVHGFRNASDADVKYLNLHAPGLRLHRLHARPARQASRSTSTRPTPRASRACCRRAKSRSATRFQLEGEGQRETLLCDIEALAISEIVAEQGSPTPEPHPHPDHVESFFVLEGEVGFVIGAEEVGAGTGTWVQVPAGAPHEIGFETGPARMLTLHTPGAGFGGFLRALDETDDETDALSARGSTNSRRDEGARPARRTVPRSAGRLAGAPKPPQGCPTAIARSAAGCHAPSDRCS